jgi:hypothetical protein
MMDFGGLFWGGRLGIGLGFMERFLESGMFE